MLGTIHCKRLWLTLAAFISILQLCAIVLSGSGVGDTPEQAKNNALSELSSTIFVQVQSKLVETNSEENYRLSSKTLKEITLESNLPIMGAEYSIPTKQKGRYTVIASLNSLTALPIYETKLKALTVELEQAKSVLSATQSDEVVYQQLLTAKTLLETFTVYKLIYSSLGGNFQQQAPYTESEVNSSITRLQQSYDDLQFALKSIAQTFGSYKNIYAHYPSVYPSDEVTQFARVVRTNLTNLLSSVDEPLKADYNLVSSYEILNDKIVQNMRLIDKQGNLRAEAILNLNPPAYQNTDYRPKSLDIAQAIEMRELVSDKLRIELSTLQGKNRQLFIKGQEVKFMVKANQPCQFYIASHVYQYDETVYSYLLSLYPSASGDARFAYRIGAEDCNRWIELSAFDATDPFGVEILQVFATTGEIEVMIPSTEFDQATGLCKLSDKPKEAIVAMRGLKPKSKGVETAEGCLTLTIMKD